MSVDSLSNIYENRTKYASYFDNSSGNDSISIDTFYQLLIAEMTNQDPLEPMSNTEFVSQMASFTALQIQQEALYYNNANYAQSMVGKTVIVAASTGTGLDVQTGVVTSVDFSGGEFTLTVNGKTYPLKNVMEVLDATQGVATGSDGAFATSLIGKYVTVGLLNSDGDAIIEEGVVQRVEIKDGEISVVIGGIAYPLYSVAKVEDYVVETSNNTTTDNGSDTETAPITEEPAVDNDDDDDLVEVGGNSDGDGDDDLTNITDLFS